MYYIYKLLILTGNFSMNEYKTSKFYSDVSVWLMAKMEMNLHLQKYTKLVLLM